MSRFHYIINKIQAAEITPFPFPHIFIKHIFEESDFSSIAADPQIKLDLVSSDLSLFDGLIESGYSCIPFPGCSTNSDHYLSWHQSRRIDQCNNVNTCEGFGLAFKLKTPRSGILNDIVNFFDSLDFYQACAGRFSIDIERTTKKSGLHKYLDGYEISPHPDIRKKALTYMVNINPSPFSEELVYHTHLMTLKKNYKYVQAFWEGNPSYDRCWLPWDWCHTEVMHSANNSILLFSPSNSSLHAVKADYNHLLTQRTQLYGNLWYHDVEVHGKPAWEDFVVTPSPVKRHMSNDY